MHRTIRGKLFLTFLVTTLFVVSGMYVFMRSSLNRGFSTLLETRQQEQVKILIEGLTDYYSNNQSWSSLSRDKQKWIELLWQSNPQNHNQPSPWIAQANKEPNNLWPPAIPEQETKKIFTPLGLRAMLLNADKTLIFGRNEAIRQLSLYPIHYKEKIIGFLGLLPGKIYNQASDIEFIERQSKSFIWIALIMILLSASLALFLTYTLGRPIKRIITAVKELAVGHYEIRLPVESKDELGQLARDFNDMAAALEQSEQSRRRWVADISHELRTPLAVLRGELEALQDGIRPLTPSAIDSLFADVMRLHRLTEDLYQLSLSDKGALSYRKDHLDPIEILKDDLASLKLKFQDKNIQITWVNDISNPIYIYADPDRLSQLYRNLLNNSASYTDNNGQLIITIFQKTTNLTINFSDSEPGVPEHEVSKLFDRFYRLESSRNRHYGGAGLGLAICRNIVEAHNGSLHAYPSPLKGLTVCIELPIN